MIRTTKLLEVADLERGTEPGRDSYCSPEEGVRFLRVGDITGKGYEEIYTRSEDVVLVEEKDILMTFDGTPGFVNRGLKGAISSGVRRITPKDENILDRNYLFYVLQTEGVRKIILKYSSGQTIIHASKSIPHIEISIPSLSEQKRIVEILEKADTLRKKRQEADELSDKTIQSIFLEMFGDPTLNPKKLKLVRCGEATLHISSGSTPLGGESTYIKEGIIFIRSQNVLMNKLELENVAYISQETHNKMMRTWVKKGDVLLNITGASIGRVTYFNGRDDSANVNQHVCIIRPKKDMILPEYLSFLISMPNYQNMIISRNSGATRQAFTFEYIKRFEIPLPPLSEQQKFADFVQRVKKVKEKQRESKQELSDIFKALMQKMFRVI